MPLSSAKHTGNTDNPSFIGGRLVAVKVIDIILDSNHPEYENYGGPESIGTIFFNKIEQLEKRLTFNYNPDHEDTGEFAFDSAKPFFSHIKYYPLKHEIVTCITLPSHETLTKKIATEHFYFPTLNIWNHPHVNTFAAISNHEKGKVQPKEVDYQQEGLDRKTPSPEDAAGVPVNIPLGKYFNERFDIRPLLPYEGDNILEGRFGNSIRLGATARGVEEDTETDREKYEFPTGSLSPWSKGGATANGDPITIIRNGQPKELTTEKDTSREGEMHIFEDINLDPSSIYLTSTQNIETFQVAADMCWYSFGMNTVIEEDKGKTAEKVVDDPSNVFAKEQEAESIEPKDPPKKPEEDKKDLLETEATGSATGSISEDEAGLNEDEKEASKYYDTPVEPEKEEIDGNLPEAYRLSDLEDVPMYATTWAEERKNMTQDQTGYQPFFKTPSGTDGKSRCENCAFFKADSSANDNQCSKWGAKVRRNWYCDSYGNRLAEIIKNVKNIGKKTFTITSPDPHVGKKGYIAQTIDTRDKEVYFEVVIIGDVMGGGDSGKNLRTPGFNLNIDTTTIIKSIRRQSVSELLGLSPGSVFIKFDDNSFVAEIGEMKIPVDDKTIGYVIFNTPKLTRWKGNEGDSKYDSTIERYSITKRTNWKTDGSVSAAVLSVVTYQKGKWTSSNVMDAEDYFNITLGSYPSNTTDQKLRDELLSKVKQDMAQRKYTYSKSDKNSNISPNNQSTITLS